MKTQPVTLNYYGTISDDGTMSDGFLGDSDVESVQVKERYLCGIRQCGGDDL